MFENCCCTSRAKKNICWALRLRDFSNIITFLLRILTQRPTKFPIHHPLPICAPHGRQRQVLCIFRWDGDKIVRLADRRGNRSLSWKNLGIHKWFTGVDQQKLGISHMKIMIQTSKHGLTWRKYGSWVKTPTNIGFVRQQWQIPSETGENMWLSQEPPAAFFSDSPLAHASRGHLIIFLQLQGLEPVTHLPTRCQGMKFQWEYHQNIMGIWEFQDPQLEVPTRYKA